MQKIKLQVKKVIERVMTFEEQMVYEHIKREYLSDEFVKECQKYLDARNIVIDTDCLGECIDGIYYNKCKEVILRDATPIEEFAYYTILLADVDCGDLSCTVCPHFQLCQVITNERGNIRDVIAGKNFVVTVIGSW